jgi:hypothetical protein
VNRPWFHTDLCRVIVFLNLFLLVDRCAKTFTIFFLMTYTLIPLSPPDLLSLRERPKRQEQINEQSSDKILNWGEIRCGMSSVNDIINSDSLKVCNNDSLNCILCSAFYAVWGGTTFNHIKPDNGWRKIILLDGFQALPARPSNKGRMKVKTLGWYEIIASDKQRNFYFLINVR